MKSKGTPGAVPTDLARDPLELKNLANDPDYAKKVEELKNLLKKMPAAGD